jgi:hypothetical protein
MLPSALMGRCIAELQTIWKKECASITSQKLGQNILGLAGLLN